jgi:glycosyltransferase involved in cell wall biosynthesis
MAIEPIQGAPAGSHDVSREPSRVPEKAPISTRGGAFAILAGGRSGTPPATDLAEYLLARGARRVTTVFHPLTAEDGNGHEITKYEPGRKQRRRIVKLPTRLPYTYPLDLLVPLIADGVDGWFAFNNLLCARGLLERRAGRASRIAYWPVDFVPNRFGPGTVLTRIYDALDAYCCRHVDLRIEISEAALRGRDAHHHFASGDGATCTIAPIGAWLDRVPVTAQDGWRSQRVVFIGSLVERMGGDTVIQALSLLRQRGCDVTADITGRGPLEEQLRAEANRLGLQDVVRFHGFIADHRELERLLSQAAVGLAPYNTRVDSFTQYADPSKLKSYLAAGLPILLTSVPPNASELAERAGAEVVHDSATDFADAIERVLANPELWRQRRGEALQYARQFDWNGIFADVLSAAGIRP